MRSPSHNLGQRKLCCLSNHKKFFSTVNQWYCCTYTIKPYAKPLFSQIQWCELYIGIIFKFHEFVWLTLVNNEFAPALILGLQCVVFHADSKSVFSFSPARLNLEIMYVCFLH